MRRSVGLVALCRAAAVWPGMLGLFGSAAVDAAGPVQLKLLAPAGYLSSIPVLVRVEALDAQGGRERSLWDATVELSADTPGVNLSTNRVVLRNGSFEWQLSAYPRRNYVIENSTNMATWGLLNVLFADTPSTPVRDSEAGAQPHRFYRARLAP